MEEEVLYQIDQGSQIFLPANTQKDPSSSIKIKLQTNNENPVNPNEDFNHGVAQMVQEPLNQPEFVVELDVEHEAETDEDFMIEPSPREGNIPDQTQSDTNEYPAEEDAFYA